MKRWKMDRNKVAVFIAILFHACGFAGLFTSKHDWFVAHTPLTLLIMFGLIIWTEPSKNKAFYFFIMICFSLGMFAEIVSVHTGLLFGHYEYGKVLGPGFFHVPLITGINWFIVIYCCGCAIANMQRFIEHKTGGAAGFLTIRIKLVSFIADGALLATFFDYILEPVANRLGYWTWLNNFIPYPNYLCWFLISAMLLTVFKLLSLPGHNQFAVHLLVIEFLFFAALRTFL